MERDGRGDAPPTHAVPIADLRAWLEESPEVPFHAGLQWVAGYSACARELSAFLDRLAES